LLVASDQLALGSSAAAGRKGRAQRADGGDLVRRLEHTALQLDALEAVQLDHAACLRHDLRRADGLAPRIGYVGFVDMFGVLEEEVGAVGHGVAHGTPSRSTMGAPTIWPCRSSMATSKVLVTLAAFFAVCEPGASSNSTAPALGRMVARTRSSMR
jgi:hypothetical protein